MRSLLALLFFAFALASCNAPCPQTTTPADFSLVAGPMLGYAEHREALIWLTADGTSAPQLEVSKHDSSKAEPIVHIEATPTPLGTTIYKYQVGGLMPGETYSYQIKAGDSTIALPCNSSFNTRNLWEWRGEPNDFHFLLGSCNYNNDAPFDRPGEPYGKGQDIFLPMAEEEADMMIWLGDNSYLREVDWSSEYGLYYRHQYDKSSEQLQCLLAAMHHYAIWDDHDFGPNNSDRGYDMKAASTQAFKDNWGNKYYGNGTQGIYSHFEWSDAEFYLLDNRSFRANNDLPDNSPDKPFLGREQLEWLKASLLSSSPKFNFRFIAVGNQVLNPMNDFEGYPHYQQEWQELQDFIVDNKISGIVFLTGDRHMTEIIQSKPKGFYTLYDVTCSPMSSGAFTNIAEYPEFTNPSRVPNTLLTEQNYMNVSIDGDRKAGTRKVTFTAKDKKGEIKFSYSIFAKDLKAQ